MCGNLFETITGADIIKKGIWFTVVSIGNFTTGIEYKYSALYLASKASALLLYILI